MGERNGAHVVCCGHQKCIDTSLVSSDIHFCQCFYTLLFVCTSLVPEGLETRAFRFLSLVLQHGKGCGSVKPLQHEQFTKYLFLLFQYSSKSQFHHVIVFGVFHYSSPTAQPSGHMLGCNTPEPVRRIFTRNMRCASLISGESWLVSIGIGIWTRASKAIGLIEYILLPYCRLFVVHWWEWCVLLHLWQESSQCPCGNLLLNHILFSFIGAIGEREIYI
jgi:hypothetical protein